MPKTNTAKNAGASNPDHAAKKILAYLNSLRIKRAWSGICTK
jgi:hypothetical protein